MGGFVCQTVRVLDSTALTAFTNPAEVCVGWHLGTTVYPNAVAEAMFSAVLRYYPTVVLLPDHRLIFYNSLNWLCGTRQVESNRKVWIKSRTSIAG